MSPEERLARLEVLISEQGKDIAQMQKDVGELMKIAHMGRGALWTVLKAGMVMIGLLGFAKLVWDLMGKHL